MIFTTNDLKYDDLAHCHIDFTAFIDHAILVFCMSLSYCSILISLDLPSTSIGILKVMTRRGPPHLEQLLPPIRKVGNVLLSASRQVGLGCLDSSRLGIIRTSCH